jgi:hypothetical protein
MKPTKEEIILLAKTSCSRTDMAMQLGITVPEICDLIKEYGILNKQLHYMPNHKVRELRGVDPANNYSQIKKVDLVVNTKPDEVWKDLPEGKLEELSQKIYEDIMVTANGAEFTALYQTCVGYVKL